MGWVKKMYVFEEGGKFKLKGHNDWVTVAFPTTEIRQWWIDNYYKKIGVVEFIKGQQAE